MDINTSRVAKGIPPGEWNHKATLLQRKKLSDITNLLFGDVGDGIVHDHGTGKKGSPQMNNEYVAKLLKENNVLMRVLAERNTEVQNLRLVVAKLNQQNWQLAQAHSQMLSELNLGKDRLKAAQHELGCTSTALKIKTQLLAEQTKSNHQRVRLQNTYEMPIETAVETSQIASQKSNCLSNRKRPQRSQSLLPMSMTNHMVNVEENLRRSVRRKSTILKAEPCVASEALFEIEDAKMKSARRKSTILKAEPCVASEDLFEIEEAKFPIFSEDKQKPTAPTNSVKVEDEEIQVTSSLKRTSLGRPLRKAAEKVSCYKEIPLNTKLRRSD